MRSPMRKLVMAWWCKLDSLVYAYPEEEQNGDEHERVYGFAQREFGGARALVIALAQSTEKPHL